MTTTGLRRWSWIHKWSSLVCIVFMLLLCLTGLPLIFHHEIAHWLGTTAAAPEMAADTPHISLDRVLDVARARYPDKGPMFVSREADNDRIWYVTLSDTPTSEHGLKQVAVDARSGKALAEPPLDHGFMFIMYSLHVDLFAGLPGRLFLGAMGLLLIVAIVSGVLLYGPFMKKLSFGTIRAERSIRLKWLDLHNLLGIVTLAWAMVVGTTGVINTLSDLVMQYWQSDQMAQMTAPYKGMPLPAQLGSLEQSVRAAERLEPTMKLTFIAFPGTTFSSPHHYAIFMRGKQPLTARLYKPVLVDAQTCQVTDSRKVPWYMTALLLSQPLHFGDYGGTPLKIIWTLLDLMTIAVLGSGLYLWLARRKTAQARLDKLLQMHTVGSTQQP